MDIKWMTKKGLRNKSTHLPLEPRVVYIQRVNCIKNPMNTNLGVVVKNHNDGLRWLWKTGRDLLGSSHQISTQTGSKLRLPARSHNSKTARPAVATFCTSETRGNLKLNRANVLGGGPRNTFWCAVRQGRHAFLWKCMQRSRASAPGRPGQLFSPWLHKVTARVNKLVS